MRTRFLLMCTVLWCGLAGAAEPQGMPFEVYIRLEYGMTEGELVLRAGRPDRQSLDNAREGLKSFYYFPTPVIPYTTTISLRSGRIVNIERVRKKL